MKLRWLVGASCCVAVFATEPNEATRRWWSHVEGLANDVLEGRDAGSLAKEYVVVSAHLDGHS